MEQGQLAAGSFIFGGYYLRFTEKSVAPGLRFRRAIKSGATHHLPAATYVQVQAQGELIALV